MIGNRTESRFMMSSTPLVSRGRLSDLSTWNIKSPASAGSLWSVGKRTFDVTSALILLVAILPLLLLIAVAIKLDSRGPVFYRVRRVGYQGRPLMMLKFRKMFEHATGGPLTAANDPRLSRVGHFLTRTRLDELPQLWDVLRGRMSVIGPRPEDPHFVGLHRADYEVILSVRPGITGMSQLAYVEESRIVDDDSPIEDYIDRIMPQKLTLDKLYASRSSLRLDLSIIRWTIITLILGRPVAVSRTTGRMNLRHRRRKSDAPSTNGRAPTDAPSTNGHAVAGALSTNGHATTDAPSTNGHATTDAPSTNGHAEAAPTVEDTATAPAQPARGSDA
jgi:lipopolysaccharide/colanic/teichoic acid biosynthesis glycosyltransferase